MIKSSFNKLLLVGLLFSVSFPLFAQVQGFNKIRWQKEKISSGLVWKSAHTVLNDSIPQNINVLIINVHKRSLMLSYNPVTNITVSKQAQAAGAIAAVNAGFFNIRDGGSVTYLRTGGLILDSDTARKWTRNSNMNGSLLIDKQGDVFIERAMTNEWYDNHQEFTEVLVTGPILLEGREKVKLPSTPLSANKHPRTAIGIVRKKRLIIITLDGRTDRATGMTLSELTELMMAFHCKDAVNLDGGGSTTMWISGKPFNGVVNMPCDNRKFDHEGERAVSDILIIR